MIAAIEGELGSDLAGNAPLSLICDFACSSLYLFFLSGLPFNDIEGLL